MNAVLTNVGYFDAPDQTDPAHNPCPGAPCPVCGKTNGEGKGGILYRSLAPLGGQRSYFFAYHTACAGDPKIDQFEDDVMTEIFAWDDAAKELPTATTTAPSNSPEIVVSEARGEQP